MPTFELTLQRKTDSGYPVIAALTRPGGFLPLRREGMLNLDAASLVELQYDPLAYGTALGQTLFVDEIRDTFREGLAAGEPLRVLLSVEAPDLRTLDWHRLAAPFDGCWRIISTQQNTPFSLSIPSPASGHFPAIGRRDLRALLLVAGPESLLGDYQLDPFDVPATTESVRTALGEIPCDILDNPSLDALCAALTVTPYTILHIVCHGAVTKSGETVLYFPKDDHSTSSGQARTPTPASDLLNRLAGLARLPHFVFLSTCESALPQNGLGSLAQRLVRELGLPAVLAMTNRVSIATAGAIAAPFYAKLYEHGQPDLALVQSLAGLQGAHDLTVPALLSRLGDRPLFDDNTARDLTDQELEFGLAKLAESLPERAPVMDGLRDALTRRLRSTLGTDVQSLSESRHTERNATLDQLNNLSLEALDLSFNALCLGQTPPVYDSRSPFRGLESFRPEDAAYFFGRETLTKRLVQKLNEYHFLAVLGASGSGKSSLVMAGLIPALNVPYAVFRPGAEPSAELEKALQGNPALLVVDQFEELFTLLAREQRAEFISRLLEQSGRLRVVITLRADFLGEVAPFKSLKDEVQNHQEIIPPMDETELRRAMEGQAGCAGLRFESDLSQQMLDDVAGEPGAMPLLQHALWTLWTRRHGRWLRADEYRAFGGVKQAIASTAEAVYARCTDFEKERLRDIFLRLTRLDESAEGRDTRHRVLLRDLIPADSDPAATTLLIKQLADTRLVVVTGDEVEVAHEALIRHWERLRAWLNDDRDNLRLREGISENAREWGNAGRDKMLLNHRGGRLDDALKLRSTLNTLEIAYLDACKHTMLQRRRLTIGSISFAVLIIMALLFGWGVTNKRQVDIAQTAQANAEQQAGFVRARELSAISVTIPYNLPQRRLLLAIEALNSLNATDQRFIDLENSLRNYLADFSVPPRASAQDEQWLVTFENDLYISPDGRWQVKLGSSTIELTDTIYQSKKLLPVEQQTVESWSFSQDGRWLAIGENMLVELWDLENLSRQPMRLEHENGVTALAFSPSGVWLATGTYYGVLRLWDLENLEPAKPVLLTYKDTDPMGPPIYSLAFSPDRRWLCVGSDGSGTNMEGADDNVQLWDMNNLESEPKYLESDEGTTNGVYVTFSPNGKWVANGGAGNTVEIWDVKNSFAHSLTLRGYEGGISDLKFSPDGNRLATIDINGLVRVLDMRTRIVLAEPLQVYGFENSNWLESEYSEIINRHWLMVNSSSEPSQNWNAESPTPAPILTDDGSSYDMSVVSTDSNWLVAVDGEENTLLLWDLRNPDSNPFELSHNASIEFLSFYPDGQNLIAVLYDYALDSRRIVKWDVQNPSTKPLITRELDGWLYDVSPSGHWLVTLDGSGVASLWDMDDSTLKPTDLPEYGVERASSILFSSDEQWFAIGTLDGIVKVWDLQHLGNTTFLTYRTATEDMVVKLEFSPNNRWLAVGTASFSNFDLEVVDTQNPSDNSGIAEESIVKFVFSSKGNWLVAGISNGDVRVWDLQNPALAPIDLLGHEKAAEELVISPNERWLASSTRNDYYASLDIQEDYILLWDMLNPELDAVRINSDIPIMFTLDNRLLLTRIFYPNYSAFQIVSVDIQDVLKIACEIVGRNFTSDEWQLYFPGEIPRATCPQWPLDAGATAVPVP